MLEENMLDGVFDFEIIHSPVENQTVITAMQYELDAIADYWTSYNE